MLKEAAGKFVGTHDFVRFAANRGKSAKSPRRRQSDTVRTIHSVRVRRSGSCVAIDFEGDGFLYKMARLMVGSLVECALGKSRLTQISERLGSGGGNSTRVAAPAEGLFLVRVRY
jgi:tRNA pseudouridine38-40 synthase